MDELAQMDENKIRELEIKAKQDVEMQRERTTFQMDKELLKLKEEQQFKVQQLQESFNDRITNLLKEKEVAAEKFKNMVLQMDKIEAEQVIIEKNQNSV